MDIANYTTLSRQVGLMREMNLIANNIANATTTGYRQQGLIFSEYLTKGSESNLVSMANGNVPKTSFTQGAFQQTGNPLDIAIEGDGFFLIDTPQGERLTRSGSFFLSSDGNLITAQGFAVLDQAQTKIFMPPDAKEINIASDGTLSADGQIFGKIALVKPAGSQDVTREDGVKFAFQDAVMPAENNRVLQRFLENSNTDPLQQIARMIEVQRAYEMGQSFLTAEDERIKKAIDILSTK